MLWIMKVLSLNTSFSFRHIKKLSCLPYYFFLLFLFNGLLSGQVNTKTDILSSFEIMRLVDDQMKIPDGLNLAQLTVASKKGSIKTFWLSHFKKGHDSLFIFKSPFRGNILKLLYNSLRQNIYAYQIHSKRLSQKKFKDRFDPVLGSGLYFIDFNLPFFVNNFISKIGEFETINKEKLVKVENFPLFNGLYGKVIVYVDPQKNYRLSRIDYFDSDHILLKTINVYYGRLPSRLKKETTLISAPVRYEIMDLSRNTISNLEYQLNDQIAQINNSIFQEENIEK